MAPVAIETFPSFTMTNGAATSSPAQKAPALVIGSLNTAQDGSYMNTISALESSRKVERQMVDRIMDGGAL